MRFPDDVSDDVLNRLRRAEGQVRGVQRLLEDGAQYKHVLTHPSPTQGSSHRAGRRGVVAGMRYCLIDPDRAAEEGMGPDDMEELFLKLR